MRSKWAVLATRRLQSASNATGIAWKPKKIAHPPSGLIPAAAGAAGLDIQITNTSKGKKRDIEYPRPSYRTIWVLSRYFESNRPEHPDARKDTEKSFGL
jgi:hypothetical protein